MFLWIFEWSSKLRRYESLESPDTRFKLVLPNEFFSEEEGGDHVLIHLRGGHDTIALVVDGMRVIGKFVVVF